MKWRIIDSGTHSASQNMAIDQNLLSAIHQEEAPILRFYGWKGVCATYGYFTNPLEHLSSEGLKNWNVDIASRPTGGGIIFHHCDLTFSVLIPSWHKAFSLNTLDNYALVNNLVGKAVCSFMSPGKPYELLQNQTSASPACEQFCMAAPTKYDVMVNGKKVGGAAQRRTKDGFLHQGSIALCLPSEQFLDSILQQGASIKESMVLHSYPLLGAHASDQALQDARRQLQGTLVNLFVSL